MTSSIFTTPEGDPCYRAMALDSNQERINEALRRDFCKNQAFQTILSSYGYGNIDPNRIVIAVEYSGNDQDSPVIRIYPANHESFTIEEDVYCNDDFMLGYVQYYCADGAPPQLNPQAQPPAPRQEQDRPVGAAPRQDAPPPPAPPAPPANNDRSQTEQALLAALLEQIDVLREELAEERTRSAEERAGRMQNIADLIARGDELLAEERGRSDERLAERDERHNERSDYLLYRSDQLQAQADARFNHLVRDGFAAYRDLSVRIEELMRDLARRPAAPAPAPAPAAAPAPAPRPAPQPEPAARAAAPLADAAPPANPELERLRQALEQAQREMAPLRAENGRLAGQVAELAGECDRLRAEGVAAARDRDDALARQAGIFDEQRGVLEGNLDQLRETLRRRIAEQMELTAEARRALRIQTVELEQVRGQLAQSVAAFEAANAQVGDLEAANAALRDQSEQAARTAEEVEARYRELKRQLDDDLQPQLRELRHAVLANRENVDQGFRDLQGRISEPLREAARKFEEAAARHATEQRALSEQLRGAAARTSTLEELVGKQRAESANLIRERDSALANVERLTITLGHKERALENQLRIKVDLGERLQRTEQAKETLDAQIAKTAAERDAVRRELAALQAVHAACSQQPVMVPERAAAAAIAHVRVALPRQQLADLPREIIEGRLEVLAQEPDYFADVEGTLGEILSGQREDADALHLAIYLASADPIGFRESELFPELLKWASVKASGGLDEGELKKFSTLSRALSKPGSYCEPLHLSLREGQIFSEMVASAGREGHRQWAKNLLLKENPTESERHFIAQLTDKFRSDDGVEALPRNLPQFTLEGQLTSNIGDPSLYLDSHSRAQSSHKDTWVEKYQARERVISGLIDELLTPESLHKRVEAFAIKEDQKLDRNDAPVDERWLRTVQGIDARGQHRDISFSGVRRALLERFKTNSGLYGSEETCDVLARGIAETGGIPPLFRKILSPQELLVTAQLFYDYMALHDAPKGGHEKIAVHSDWDWLIEGKEPKEATELLFGLMKKWQNRPEFQREEGDFAYPITEAQADWAHKLYKHLRGGGADPIYADAGRGKTSIVKLAVDFCEKHLPECRDTTVHLLGPSKIARNAGLIVIPVDDVNSRHAVIVDEGHLLLPDARIVIKSGGIEVEKTPLIMTATPTIPKKDTVAFKQGPLTDALREEIPLIQGQLVEIEESVEREMDALHKNYIASCAKKIKDQIPACSANMPNARSERYTHIVKEAQDFLTDPFAYESTNAVEALREQLSSWVRDCDRRGPYYSMFKKYVELNARLLQSMIDDLSTLINALERRPAEEVLLPFATGGGLQDLVTRRDDLRQLDREIRGKIEKWSGLSDIEAREYERVESEKKRFVEAVRYEQMRNLTDLDEIAAAAADQLAKSQEEYVQLIFPGVRFDAIDFGRFRRILGRDAPVHFVYQGSEGDRAANQKVVMLYDETNMQGGDFGPLSFAGEHEIDQFVFFNTKGRSETLSENDLLQALGRRRGTSRLDPHVYGTQEGIGDFLAQAHRNQKRLEAEAALRDASIRIARKVHKLGNLEETLPDLTREAKGALVAWKRGDTSGLEDLIGQASNHWKTKARQMKIRHLAEWYAAI